MLFFVDEAAWNEHRKCHILMAGGLKTAVEGLLDVLPERPAVRPNDHAAANRRVVGELRFQDELVVPFGKVLRAGGELFFGHAEVYPFLSVAIIGAE